MEDNKRKDEKGSEVDYHSVFPGSKIKTLVMRDEGMGRMSSKAVSLIGACSAIFIKKLVDSSVEQRTKESNIKGANSSDSSCKRKQTISLEDIQTCVQNEPDYDFLADVVRDLKEETSPKPKRKKLALSKEKKVASAEKKGGKVLNRLLDSRTSAIEGGMFRKVVDDANASRKGTALVMDDEDYD